MCRILEFKEATIDPSPHDATDIAAHRVADAADRLADVKFEIIEQWIDEVRQRNPAARGQPNPVIRNSLDEFFSNLENLLRNPDRDSPYDQELDVAKEHGQQRGSLTGYTLDQVLTEYATLRRVILRFLRESGPLSDRETDIILDFIQYAMAGSGAEFAAVHEMERLRSLEIEKEYSRKIEAERTYLRNLLDTVPSIFYTALPDGSTEFYNRRYYEYTGANPHETSPYGWEAYIHPDDLAPMRASWQHAREAGEPIHQEFRIRGADGIYRWHFAKSAPLRDEHGNIVKWVGVSPNIHMQKELQNTLSETQEHLHLALKSAQMGTWHLDLQTNSVTTSEESAAILGDALQQVDIDHALQSRIHPDDLEEVKRVLAESIRNRTTYSHDLRIVRKDSAVRWLMSRGTLKLNDKGEPVSMSGVFADVTEQKKAEAKLASEKHKFETIFQDAPAAIGLFRGPDFVFENLNPAFRALFEGRELLGKSLHEALPELIGQPFHMHLRKVLETGEPYIGREEKALLARREGGILEERYFDFTYSRLNDADGKPYGVLDHAIDVTEKVLVRKTLEESRQRLEVAVKGLEIERELRARFVLALSHDLRTPLAAAKMSSQLLSRAQSDHDKVHKLAVRIGDNMDRADHMIRDLLDANRIQAGQALPLEINHCNLNDVVQNTLNELATLHGNRFVMRAAQQLLGNWDCAALRRIVENLAGNAVKYGFGETPVTVELQQVSAAEMVISVHNLGDPISQEEQVTLFQPFRRASSAQRGRQTGWGIGLTLVQGLAEAHGGHVEVESTLEKGTLFRVLLPLDARPFQKE